MLNFSSPSLLKRLWLPPLNYYNLYRLPVKTNVKQGAHIHQPTAWLVPHAQPYHQGSDSHGQQFCPHSGSSAWHSRRVHERTKSPCIKEPLLPRRMQSTPVRASSTQHMWELLAGNCTALFPRHARGKRIRSYPDLCASCCIRETEDCGEFNISLQLCTVLNREIVIFCAAFLRKYSYICSHYGFTSFYAMWSPRNFKVPLTLTVKKKRIVRFEGLPPFKRSDLGEQDVVGQGSFGTAFMVFDSSG